jgi:hypothetical protein
MKNVRGVSAEVNPKALAVWTLPMFYKRLREWAYEIYDTTVHRTLGQSPRQMFAYGAKRSGQRSHRLISYDDFKILSLPAPSGRGGRRKIRRSDGIQVNYIQYWCDVFKDPRLWNRSVPVRYDPFNIDVAYAYVGSTWHQCRSRHSHLLRYRTERELQIATEAIRQRRRNGQRASMTGYQIAQFLGSVTEDEALLTEHWKALENAEILADINEERTPAPESDTPDLVEKDDDVENASDIGLGFTYDDLETYGEY